MDVRPLDMKADNVPRWWKEVPLPWILVMEARERGEVPACGVRRILQHVQTGMQRLNVLVLLVVHGWRSHCPGVLSQRE